MNQTFRPYRTCPELQPLVDKYWANRDWGKYFFTLANHERAAALLDLFHHTNRPSRLWRHVNDVWSMSNSISADENLWDEIWEHSYRRDGTLRRCHRFVMRAADRRTFGALPETVMVYRGCNSMSAAYGYSWTLDRSVAEFFAHRVSLASGEPLVAIAAVPRWFILAYFNEREEQEIVVNRQMFDEYGLAIDVEVAQPESGRLRNLI